MGNKVKGILELQLNKEEVIFHTKNEDIIVPSLDAFLYNYSNTYGTIVYINEKYFNPIE